MSLAANPTDSTSSVCSPVAEGRVRKAKVPGFKSNIYYFVRGDEIVVYRVMHQRQHPDAWKKRS